MARRTADPKRGKTALKSERGTGTGTDSTTGVDPSGAHDLTPPHSNGRDGRDNVGRRKLYTANAKGRRREEPSYTPGDARGRPIPSFDHSERARLIAEGLRQADFTRSYTEVTHPDQRAFLAVYPLLGTIAATCRVVGVDRTTVLRWRDMDERFAQYFLQAQEHAVDLLEQEAIRRAVQGTRRWKFHSKTGAPLLHPETQQPYVEDEYSDHLLMFLLKGARPDKYRDRSDGAAAVASDHEKAKQAIVDALDRIAAAAPDVLPRESDANRD